MRIPISVKREGNASKLMKYAFSANDYKRPPLQLILLTLPSSQYQFVAELIDPLLMIVLLSSKPEYFHALIVFLEA